MLAQSRLWALAALLASLAMPGARVLAGPVLTRGPYLQSAGSDTITIRWRTDQAVIGRVRFGAAPAALDQIADEADAGTEHEVSLTGLTAATRYAYSVGTTAEVLAGGDAEHVFSTSPIAGSSAPTRIWVIGDSGTADPNAAAVRDTFLAFAGDERADLWLMLGDNAYTHGTDQEYQAAVFEMYPTLLRNTSLWPTLGNHDGLSADSATGTGVYYDVFSLPRTGEAGGVASHTEAYYSFDYANLHLVCLDSYDSDLDPGGAMLTWLEDDLAATAAQWIVAFWHHPPYSKGSHDSDVEQRLVAMRTVVVPVLEAHGVDLVLAGHSHAYERSVLLDGHYGASGSLAPTMALDGGDGRIDGDGAYRKPGAGPAPRAGAVYVVAGSSGRLGGGSLDHPAMATSVAALGSVVIDVEGARLDLTFLDAAGEIGDRVTMIKGDLLHQDGFEGGGLDRWTRTTPP